MCDLCDFGDFGDFGDLGDLVDLGDLDLSPLFVPLCLDGMLFDRVVTNHQMEI